MYRIAYFFSDIRTHETRAKMHCPMSYVMANVWTFESWMKGFVVTYA